LVLSTGALSAPGRWRGPRGRVERPEEFGDLVLRQGDGHPVHVKDVGRGDGGVAAANTLASINGDPTVLLQVRKQSGTNTVEVVNNVKERVPDVKKTRAQR